MLLSLLFRDCSGAVTVGRLCEALGVAPLAQHQSQNGLTQRCPGRSARSRKQIGVMLRDETGAHVSGLELRVGRETQQEVYVGVQAYDLSVIHENTQV